MKNVTLITLALSMLICLVTNAQERAVQAAIQKKQTSKMTIKSDTATSLKIKCSRTITTAYEPLYIVDGIPINTAQFAKINPNEIEVISILNQPALSCSGNNKTVVIRMKKGTFKKL